MSLGKAYRGACMQDKGVIPNLEGQVLNLTTEFGLMAAPPYNYNLARCGIDWNFWLGNARGSPTNALGETAQQASLRCANAADAAQINVVWHNTNADVCAFGGSWQNVVSKVTQPPAGYADVWDYFFQSCWLPLIQTVDSHPSTMGYSLYNEPFSNGNVGAFHTYLAQRIRAVTNKTIVWEPIFGYDLSTLAGTEPQGVSNLTAGYSFYSGGAASFAQAANALGVAGKYYEEFNTGTVNSVQDSGTFDVAMTYFHWTQGGSAADQSVASLYAQFLGPAAPWGGGGPPPPSPTLSQLILDSVGVLAPSFATAAGRAIDSNNALMPGVVVTISDTGGAFSFTTMTNNAGQFSGVSSTAEPPGTYNLRGQSGSVMSNILQLVITSTPPPPSTSLLVNTPPSVSGMSIGYSVTNGGATASGQFVIQAVAKNSSGVTVATASATRGANAGETVTGTMNWNAPLPSGTFTLTMQCVDSSGTVLSNTWTGAITIGTQPSPVSGSLSAKLLVATGVGVVTIGGLWYLGILKSLGAMLK